MRTRLLVLCTMWLLGLFAGIFTPAAAASWVAAGILVAILYYRWPTPWHFIVAGMALFFLGQLWALSSQHERLPQRACAGGRPLSAVVEERIKLTSGAATYVVRAADDCRILLEVSRWPGYSAHDQVTLHGSFLPVDEVARKNPGYASYLGDQGINLIARYPRVHLVSTAPTWQTRGYEAVRARIIRIFIEPETSFVLALLLGDHGEIPPRVQSNFRAVGITHILSISGLNISLLAGVLVGLALVVPVPPWIRTALVLFSLWAYLSLINYPLPAVRAGIFWTLFLLGVRLQRLVSLATVFVVTNVAVLSVNPTLFRSISWQLSMMAMAGIGAALFLSAPYRSPVYPKRRVAVLLLAPTIGATVATWPLVAYHFGTVAVSGLVVTLLLEPVVPFMILGSLLLLAISMVLPAVAAGGAYLTHLAWLWIDTVTTFFSQLPFLYFEQVTVPAWYLAGYYIAAGLFSWGMLHYQKRSWRHVWQ